MGLLAKLLGRTNDLAHPLYDAVVARARQPHWYVAGAVPDTVDGRFDMVAAIQSLVLLRLEEEPDGVALGVRLTEAFVEDMDGQLREIGIGDIIVGKHVGRMMGMLGGRVGAYREGIANGFLDVALVRNLYRGQAPELAALTHVREALLAFHAGLCAAAIDALAAGMLPG
jgi:cytochrome b pre-mRNA-processing protein 3